MSDSNGLWRYLGGSGHEAALDLTGFAVHALDGYVGKVDRHTVEVDAAYLVVDTGWLFGHQVLLPAGTVTKIDPAERIVHIGRTKTDIRSAPPFLNALDPAYFQLLGGYYGPLA
ncbi:PRC-barrel domain containing protein [Streptomyces sp. BE20]|uniref:PRC-barrel domain containing protein n=1 Tax=Streptomycetaceae TaxID=2062 RepID=UPI002E77A140|nr:PRC-barrel domain containing protein [Streptomyces sp. BE20]MEE1824845.1 PRC-barrel domain containing protein [Streptomyces sp. BE20]